MTDTPDDVSATDPVRRGLVAYAETINDLARTKRELEDVRLALMQEQAKTAGLENELRRAEIHRDQARVERDAAIGQRAVFEVFVTFLRAQLAAFELPAEEVRKVVETKEDKPGDAVRDGRFMVQLWPEDIVAINGSATPAGDTAGETTGETNGTR